MAGWTARQAQRVARLAQGYLPQTAHARPHLAAVAGIKSVYYRDGDDKTDGLEYLRAHGVEVDSGWITGRVAESWAERNGVAG